MQSAERNYPIHEQELLAVIHWLRTWRYYLDGTRFTVNTDHATFHRFPSQPKLTRRQAGWMELLREYDSDFKYSASEELTISCPTPSLADLTTANLTPLNSTTSVCLCFPMSATSLCKTTRTTLASDHLQGCLGGKVANGYRFENDLLYCTRRGATTLAIPRHSPIRLTLLRDAHDSAAAGHFGVQKTYVLATHR
ncbi:hypothetical protein EMPS_09880 [Entomortierella parvispora]|uniref:Reverse transcriptase RNase H-like domain-containing protein n=1 Tax=Entomortierella parvispora TaxID=205924 RepID=A0A9P3HJ22_9FUNG|nr:hypothetical protein EMPS_09880 [Entomortierella parvispora]